MISTEALLCAELFLLENMVRISKYGISIH